MFQSYMGSPITCWTPAEFVKSWNQYARDFCFIENTYYVPLLDPELPDEREKTELPYYQVLSPGQKHIDSGCNSCWSSWLRAFGCRISSGAV